MMALAQLELDLPLADTPASRFLTWIMAALVGLAVLALAVAAGAHVTLRERALAPQTVTAALPAALDPAVDRADTERALELLRRTPGVAYATPVAREELDKLVEPWLGPRDEGQPSLPMPRLIDVGFNPGVNPDLAALTAQLQAISPGAQIEPAAPLAEPAEGGGASAARSLRLIASSLGLAVLASVLLVVVVVTRLSLDLHAETVDLLRLMGARDRYVARQFEQHALASGLRGGLAGFTVGLVAVIGFILLSTALPGLGLPPLPLRAFDWVLLACVPVVAALLTALAARLAATYGLARLG